MPSAPCTSGSTTSAAILPGRAAKIRSTAVTHSMQHAPGARSNGQR
jgi:hypothetical protein